MVNWAVAYNFGLHEQPNTSVQTAHYRGEEAPSQQCAATKRTVPSAQRTKKDDAGKNDADNFDGISESHQRRLSAIGVLVPIYDWRPRLVDRAFRRGRVGQEFRELLVRVCLYTLVMVIVRLHQYSLLSERVPAKLAVFMAVRAVLACEMTFRTGLATRQRLVFSARITSSS